MAGAGYVIKTGITFDTKGAQRQVSQLVKVVTEFSKKRNEMAKELEEAIKRGDAESEKFYQKEVRRLNGLISVSKKQLKAAIDSRDRIKNSMQSLSGMQLNELKRIEKLTMGEIEKLRVSGDKDNKEWARQLTNHLKHVRLEMDNVRAGFPDLQKQMENFGGKSVLYLKSLLERLRLNRDAMSETTTGGFNQTMYDYIGKKMSQINDQIKIMEGGWANLKTSSTASLEAQKKHWETMVANSEKGSAELQKYEENLKKVVAEEERRQKTEAKKIVKKVNDDRFKGTITATKEAIEMLQKYRLLLEPGKTPQTIFDQTDRAIARLTTDLKVSEAGFTSITSLMENAAKVSKGTFDGSRNSLLQVKAALEAYKGSLSATDTKKLQQVEVYLKDIEIYSKNAGLTQEQLNRAISSPKTASYNQLKAAAEKLTFELKNLVEGQTAYNKKAEELRRVNSQIQNITKSWNEQTGTLANVFSRLKSYVMIYMGFQQALAKTREFISGNLELSDQMTNVQKVTNMTNEEIVTLTSNLQALDTRTTTTELMQFAEQAGKLGLYTQHGVKGMQEFVQMAERINSTLGEDIGGAEAVASLAKVSDIMGETAKLGGSVAAALDAVGSSILSVGNQSAASYASVVNYTGRLGAIGAACEMSITDIIALGAELDALKMPAEAGSTAMAQFISAISNNVDSMAKAAGVSVVELRKQVKGYVDDLGNAVAPDMLGAIKTLLDAVSRGAASAQDLMNAMTGRSRTNVNIRSTIQLLASHLEDLNKQQKYAIDGYESATKSAKDYTKSALELMNAQANMSVMSQEFARVNENAAGIMKRLGNSIREAFINPDFIESMRKLLSRLTDFVKWITSSEYSAISLKTALVGLAAYMYTCSTAAKNLGNEIMLFSTKAMSVFSSSLKAIPSILKTVTVGMYGYMQSLLSIGTVSATTRTSMERLKTSLKGLKELFWSNPVGIYLTAMTALAYAIKKVYDRTKELKEETALYSKEAEKEQSIALTLFRRLESLNKGTKEYSDLITEINNKYGTLIGFMLSEADAEKKIASARQLVIDKLKEEALLKKQNSVIEKINEKYEDDYTEHNRKLAEHAAEVYPAKAFDITSIVQREVTSAISGGLKNRGHIFSKVKESLRLNGFPDLEVFTGETSVSFANDIKNIIDTALKIDEETKTQLGAITGELEGVRKAKSEDAYKISESIVKEINKIQEGSVTNEELGTYVSKLQEYLNVVRDNNLEGAQIKKNVANVTKELIKYRDKLKDYNKKGIREAIWGKDGDTLQTMMTETLKSMVKRYDDIENDINDTINITQTFPELIGKVDGMNAEQIRNYLYQEASRAREELARRNDNKSGDFKWDKSGRGKSELKRQLREEMNAYIRQLDEYYERRKELIEEARANEEITEEEMNRRINANETEHLSARIKLRNGYLRRSNQLTQAEMDRLNDYFQSLDEDSVMFTKNGIEKLGSQLEQLFGKGLTQEISLAAQKDATSIQKILLAHKKKIEEALLEGNFTEKVIREWQGVFDSLGMLFSSEEIKLDKATEQNGRQRIRILQEIAQDAFAIEEKGLKARLLQHDEYFNWVSELGEQERLSAYRNAILTGKTVAEATEISLEAKQEVEKQTLSLMLERLRDYNTAYVESVQKTADKAVQIAQDRWDNVQNRDIKIGYNDGTVRDEKMSSKDFWKRRIGEYEKNVEMSKLFQGWDYIGGQDITDDAELKLYQLRLEASQEWVKQLQNEIQKEIEASDVRVSKSKQELERLKQHGATQKELEDAQAEADMAREEREMLDLKRKQMLIKATEDWQEAMTAYMVKQSEDFNRTAEKMKMYYDNLNDFAYNFGQNVFGSKEDRQQAAKDLLISVMTTSEKIIEQWLVQLATKKFVNQAEILEEQAKATRMLAINAQLTGQSLMLHGTEVEASVALNSAEATSKEAAKKGWIGLAVGAAIAAALKLLLGTAMSRVNKAKSEVASIAGSSSKRLTTGMLTYAEGKYPVLGNDGEVYNAKYEKRLTTGIYRGPRFGIFSEKKPEAVIDGETTQKLLLDYPAIWKNILTISKNGRLVNGGGGAMATHAAGTLEEVTRAYTQVTSQPSTEATGNNNDALNNTLQQLIYVLTSGQIKTSIDMHGKNGLRQQLKRADRFMERRNLP